MTNLRKQTPDSEAVVSSEDERPWPAAPAFGTLPHKENGMSGISGGIWATQKRGSFKLEKPSPFAGARDSRIGAVNPPRNALRSDRTPSPSASDGSGALPFSIPLQPTPKAVRSFSHSQGQRDGPPQAPSGSRSNEHSMAPSLGYLPEEVDTETESELGDRLSHTLSHPPMSSLQRIVTLPPSFYATGHSQDSIAASDQVHAGSRVDRKLEASFAHLGLDSPQRRAQWQTHLGWDDVPNVNESRRHSMADMPTRRSSLAGVDGRSPPSGSHFWSNGLLYNWEEETTRPSDHSYREAIGLGVAGHEVAGSNDASSLSETHSHLAYNDPHDSRAFDIPSMYKTRNLTITDQDRSGEQSQNAQGPSVTIGHWTGGGGHGPGRAPRKILYIVSFKCSRVEVFYLLEGTGLKVDMGNMVIVEADRGQDLGTVQHADVTPEEARILKRKYGEEQYKWLMMFSKNNAPHNINPNAPGFTHATRSSPQNPSLMSRAPATMQGTPRGDMTNLKPKAIKRLAQPHEIRMLCEKEGNEAKAKRTCQQKVAQLHLDMEILDAEWQWDFQKVIFYYYADHYIDFKNLITELYRIYKARIWMSAINPASFSQHAAGQPPSGIAPGAVGGFNPGGNSAYHTGADSDPYGAIPPYTIGYDTYTPNWPAIPGVPNSFPPPLQQGLRGIGPSAQGYALPLASSSSGNASASNAQRALPTSAETSGYYYPRGPGQEQPSSGFTIPSPYAIAPPPDTEFYAYNPFLVPPPNYNATTSPGTNTQRFDNGVPSLNSGLNVNMGAPGSGGSLASATGTLDPAGFGTGARAVPVDNRFGIGNGTGATGGTSFSGGTGTNAGTTFGGGMGTSIGTTLGGGMSSTTGMLPGLSVTSRGQSVNPAPIGTRAPATRDNITSAAALGTERAAAPRQGQEGSELVPNTYELHPIFQPSTAPFRVPSRSGTGGRGIPSSPATGAGGIPEQTSNDSIKASVKAFGFAPARESGSAGKH